MLSVTLLQLPEEFKNYLNPEFINLVFINGHFSQENSDIDQLTELEFTRWDQGLKNGQIDYWQKFWEQKDPSTLVEKLNWSLANDGQILTIPTKLKVTKPIHFLYVNTKEMLPMVHHSVNRYHLG